MSQRSKVEHGVDWVKESHFRWARHTDAAECYWRTATEQVRALVEGLHAEAVELEARLQAGLDREKLMESEIERLRADLRLIAENAKRIEEHDGQ